MRHTCILGILIVAIVCILSIGEAVVVGIRSLPAALGSLGVAVVFARSLIYFERRDDVVRR